MTRLVSVSIGGSSDQGRFHGELEFGDGPVVISGANHIGKTLMMKAVSWCLGLEPLYGVPRSDSSFFPEAARLRADLGRDTEARIQSSVATIRIRREDEEELRLERSVAGGDPDFIDVHRWNPNGDGQQIRLAVAQRTMADRTGGFHAFLFDWMGLPVVKLRTKAGRESPLYLENLAAMFAVEQLHGWIDVQRNQVHRYQIIDVEAATVEYLLGLDATLARRAFEQSRGLLEARLRESANAITNSIDGAVRLVVGEYYPKWPHRLDLVAKRFAEFELVDFIGELTGSKISEEGEALRASVAALQEEIDSGTVSTSKKNEQAKISAAVVRLKRELHDKNAELSRLVVQRDAQVFTLEKIVGQHRATRDLARLQSEGIGLPRRIECPTCHQSLDPEVLELGTHGPCELDRLSHSLDAERGALRRSLVQLEGEIATARLHSRRLEEQLQTARRRLRMVTQAATELGEVAIAKVTEILKYERRIDVLDSIVSAGKSIQQEIRQWVEEFEVTEQEQEPENLERDHARLAALRQKILEYLTLLRHKAILKTDASGKFMLDEKYRSVLDDRLLIYTSSDSDRARLVFSHVLAVLTIALTEGGHHPGFVLLDEPLQQNPDAEHRPAFLDALASLWPALRGQVLIMTTLQLEERAALASSGVRIISVEGYFLQLESSMVV